MKYYEEREGILDKVEPIFQLLASKHELKGASVERWRWDEPDISLSWVGADKVNRNIHVLIAGEDPHELVVQLNAWRDEDEQDGKIRVRKWLHADVEKVKIPPDTGRLEDVLEKAYNIVSAKGSKDLTEVSTLSPAAQGL